MKVDMLLKKDNENKSNHKCIMFTISSHHGNWNKIAAAAAAAQKQISHLHTAKSTCVVRILYLHDPLLSGWPPNLLIIKGIRIPCKGVRPPP